MITETLSEARTVIKKGDKAAARKLLRKAILQSPQNAEAWFLLAQVVEERSQVLDCLQRVQKLDPENLAAGRALASLSHDPGFEVQTQVKRVYTEQEIIVEDLLAVGQVQDAQERRRHVNWSLVIGAVIVFIVAVIALVGPQIAPGDPLEENVIIKFGDVWETPPIAPFAYKEYPLGTDQFGRDLFSRVLWAVQPTVTMVAVVSLVRLVFGTVIGLGAGWSRGLLGNWLDTAISSALAVPVFLVALGVIAMLGAEMGLMAFVIGFLINGWGETARIIRTQTQMIRQQLYVEAAESIGASQFQVLFGHILRQIMPMVWMLFAFEISNTLMVTAGLGFLGYYIGGDVWIEVGDFVSRRVSGMPELGQMLATSWSYLTKPWPMVIVGTIIFIMVLGFNLFGEGLRLYLNPEKARNKKLFMEERRNISWWLEEQFVRPAKLWVRDHVVLASSIGVSIILIIAGFYVWQTWFSTKQVDLTEALVIPGDHFWASERGDPYGTSWSKVLGPTQPQIQWQLHIPEGFAGGPAVAENHTIYIGVNDGRLLALKPDSDILWEVSLPEIPAGPPALSADGRIYIGGLKGGLMAIDPQGELLWHYEQEDVGQPIHGPIVDPVGNIYYLLDDPKVDHLVSLTPEGNLRWSIRTGTKSADVGPRLGTAGDVIYLKNMVIDPSDGSLIEIETPADQDPVLAKRAQYLIGADGENYLHVGHTIIHWQLTEAAFEVLQSAEWDYQAVGFNQFSNYPQDAGVTLNQVVWLFYSWRYGGTKLVWADTTGKLIGISWTNLRQRSRLVAIDASNTAFICGLEGTPEEELAPITKCLGYNEGGEEPIWELILTDQNDSDVIGAAMTPGRLYVVTEDGFFYTLEDYIDESGGGS